jgi:hypothetical protein
VSDAGHRDNGPPLDCGYVYHLNAADASHSPVQIWRQQDWVEFRESKPAVPTRAYFRRQTDQGDAKIR